MHSITEVGTNVPAFLAKLWKLVDDPSTNELICWSDDGSSFVIHNQAQFCHDLLPLYYKHNNMASFVRQLNMYGFHKKVSVDAGGLKLDRDEMEFAHQYFLRNQAYLLERIKRKITESGRGGGKSPEVISRVLGDVKQMKGRQETLDTKLSAMKRENEALWRELAVLRQKHLKQQQIVNKLIQFLLTVVQTPGNRLGLKRRHTHLMLNDKAHHSDGDHHHHHHHKHKHHHKSRDEASSSASPPAASATVTSPLSLNEELNKLDELRSGPTIHELDPSTEYILPDNNEFGAPTPQVATPSPLSTNVDEEVEEENPTLGLNLDQETALDTDVLLDDATCTSRQEVPEKDESTSDVALMASNKGEPALDEETAQSTISRDEIDNHLDSMQTDLDGLKELLSKEACSLDANTLLSLFADDPISLGMGLPSQDEKDDDYMGSELIAYNPTLFDLTDDLDTQAEASSLFAEDAENLLSNQDSNEAGSELTTPSMTPSSISFPEPAKKKRK